MTGQEFLVEKGLVEKDGKVLLEFISDKIGSVNLASLLDEYASMMLKPYQIIEDVMIKQIEKLYENNR